MARASTGTPGATTLSTARAAISATSISATNNLNTSAPPLCAPRMGPLSLCFARRFRKDHSGGLHNLSIRSAGVQPGATLAERPRGDPGRSFLPEKLLFELLARGPLREPAVFVLLVGAVTGILTAAVAILSGRHLRPDGLDGSRDTVRLPDLVPHDRRAGLLVSAAYSLRSRSTRRRSASGMRPSFLRGSRP